MALRRSSMGGSRRISGLSRSTNRRTSEIQLDDRTSLSRSTFRPHNDRLSFNNVEASSKQPDDDSSSNESEDRPRPLHLVTSKAWSIYRASPLYGFKNNASSLKSYGRLLRNYLQSQRIDVAKDVRYQVKFTVLKGLKWTDHDTDALQVEVLTITEGARPLVLYLGILLSWGSSKETVSEHCVYLPLLLCISSVRMAWSVHSILNKLFDCVVHTLEVSQDDLMWLSTIANSKIQRPDTGKRLAEFNYICPHIAKGSISVQLPPKSVRDLWSKIHDRNIKQIIVEEVYRFHRTLGEQVSVVHKIKHSLLQLSRFDLPNMSMALGGRLRMRTVEAAECVLHYLYSMTVIIEGPSPMLSINV